MDDSHSKQCLYVRAREGIFRFRNMETIFCTICHGIIFYNILDYDTLLCAFDINSHRVESRLALHCNLFQLDVISDLSHQISHLPSSSCISLGIIRIISSRRRVRRTGRNYLSSRRISKYSEQHAPPYNVREHLPLPVPNRALQINDEIP